MKETFWQRHGWPLAVGVIIGVGLVGDLMEDVGWWGLGIAILAGLGWWSIIYDHTQVRVARAERRGYARAVKYMKGER